jgi:hypothetical protein
MQLGEAMEEVFPGRVGTFGVAAITGKALAFHVVGDVALHVGPRAKSSVDAGEDDDTHLWIIISRPHVFAHLGHRAVFLCRPDKGVHAFGSIEFDPQNTVILRLVQQIVDKLRSHSSPP